MSAAERPEWKCPSRQSLSQDVQQFSTIHFPLRDTKFHLDYRWLHFKNVVVNSDPAIPSAFTCDKSILIWFNLFFPFFIDIYIYTVSFVVYYYYIYIYILVISLFLQIPTIYLLCISFHICIFTNSYLLFFIVAYFSSLLYCMYYNYQLSLSWSLLPVLLRSVKA